MFQSFSQVSAGSGLLPRNLPRQELWFQSFSQVSAGSGTLGQRLSGSHTGFNPSVRFLLVQAWENPSLGVVQSRVSILQSGFCWFRRQASHLSLAYLMFQSFSQVSAGSGIEPYYLCGNMLQFQSFSQVSAGSGSASMLNYVQAGLFQSFSQVSAGSGRCRPDYRHRNQPSFNPSVRFLLVQARQSFFYESRRG